jgi:hypothetical protein
MRGATVVVIACVSLVAVATQFTPRERVDAQSTTWPEAIRQCWNDAVSNSSVRCYYTEGKLRGSKSGKDCLVEAVKAGRQGDREGALRWILACQCGNGDTEVKQALRDHQDDAVRLVIDTYGAFVQ